MYSKKNTRPNLGMRMLTALLCISITSGVLEPADEIFLEKTEIENSKKSTQKKDEKLEKEVEDDVEKDHFLLFNISKNTNFITFRYAQNSFTKSKLEYIEILSPPPQKQV